ncbi:MAG: metallophosphoesterase [Clostridia bacterium]|nr:metallophosphoesterase [Clostridia bacterium]
MKKTISILLAILFMFSCGTAAFAADDGADPETPAATSDLAAALEGVNTLQFKEDGTFKIMQINDTQDTDKMNKRTKEFIRAAVKQEQPDLIVVPGDILNDVFLFANAKRVKAALRNFASLLNEFKIPFAVTMGNHDHDRSDAQKVSIQEMRDIFSEYEYCIFNDGCDPFTFNIPVLDSTGTKLALNIYIMDSNNKSGLANGYTGCYPEQVEWYKNKCDELAALNGGEVVPSIVYQHVPVKEIYQCLEKTTVKESNNAIFSLNDYKWYKVKKEYLVGDNNVVGEAPCSETFDSPSGQYDAWVEKGDVFAAFFAHDHVNNFVMKSDDGIIMGYNGGTGFAAYGDGDKRTIRMFDFKEDDVKNFTTRTLYYRDVTGKRVRIVPIDLMSTAIFGDILRFLARMIFLTPWKGMY